MTVLTGCMLFVALFFMAQAHEVEKPCIIMKNKSLPRDCSDVFDVGKRQSGVYLIKPYDYFMPFKVYCDISRTEAWTVIMARFDGSVNFNRTWSCYKNGFGDRSGEYWLGNDHIFQMTSHRDYKLRVDYRLWTGGHKYSIHSSDYSSFRIESEVHRYKLHIGDYSKCTPDYDGLSYHNGMFFSTRDNDNDRWTGNCAHRSGGGFWFNGCLYANPTGLYQSACPHSSCMWWRSKATKTMIMKITPIK